MTGPILHAGTGRLLAVDTATQETVVALGDGAGGVIADDRWRAGHLHGERLLASVLGVLSRAGSSLGELAAVVVGLGPGSFTGLRVGLASAKGLAFGLEIPIVGIETAVALATADAGAPPPDASGATVVLLPAGPGGRYRAVVEHADPGGARLAAPPMLIAADADPDVPLGARLLAVDLADAPADARAAGERARRGLGESLLRLGADRLASHGADDLAELVPVYVTLPRGVAAGTAAIVWSPDLR